MGLNMRKSVIFTIRGCFRSICNHPFLVFSLCVLTFICRLSPFMFSLLVYVSPVFVCTAVLLGTLLYFGQHNAPRIEMKEKTTHETKDRGAANRSCGDSIFVEIIKSRLGEKQRDNVEPPTDEVRGEDRVDDHALSSKKLSGEFGEEHKDERSFSDKKVMENNSVDDNLESEYEKSEAESYDSEMVTMDSLDSQSHSAWKQSKHGDEEEEEEDALDSEFDGAESSSPDASMAEMMPMLDELHPLLDEEATQLVQTSRAVSEAPSERYSPRSSIESIGETENPEDSEVPDDDKEEQATIVWTEEDKRNLMDVGSSEIERNKRLESLILRRRSWKNTSMVPEINLIDLESSDFPYHMMHISTTRHNPFELPHDSDTNSGLPPVPSSAPPVLLPRRNPFDVPYHQMGDGFQEDHFKTAHHVSREPFFRPYFVPEVAMVSEEASESSVAETDSGSSDEGAEEEQKVEEEEEEEEEEDIGLSEDDAEVPNYVTDHGSQSSEAEECLELGSVENKEKSEEEKIGEYNSSSEAVDSRRSSEASERERLNGEAEVSRQASDVSDHVPNKEPVYDLSPTAETSTVVPESSVVLERVRTGGGGGEAEADEVVTPNSDDDYVEANDKLISTPSAGGTTSHLLDRLLHEREFKQVQVSNSPAGDLHSASSMASDSRVDMQTTDEMKKIDRGLDSVGDFSVNVVEVKPDDEKVLPMLDRDKEKRCKNLDSYSSKLSIESNSSESKENKQVMIFVKRRLSTPF